MMTYLARRLSQMVLVIIGVTLLTFMALHLAGDPTYLYVSERATEEEVAATRAKLGFDKPLYEQYANYLWGLARLRPGQLAPFPHASLRVGHGTHARHAWS